MWEIIVAGMVGGMAGLLGMGLLNASKYSQHELRIQELQYTIKHLQQRGRKPQPKKKPVRRRNA